MQQCPKNPSFILYFPILPNAKFYIEIKYIKVNLGSLFEQKYTGLRSLMLHQSFIKIRPVVPGKIYKVFRPYISIAVL